jgi:hypothetical protein
MQSPVLVDVVVLPSRSFAEQNDVVCGHGHRLLPNAYSRYKVKKKRRLCIFPKKRTKIDPCLQYPHVESTTLMTENIESEKHWSDVD